MSQRIAVMNQQSDGEDRVALVPAGVKKLKAMNVDVVIEAGAGNRAGIRDADFSAVGATVSPDAQAVNAADVVLAVRQPSVQRIGQLKPGSILIGLLSPLGDRPLVDALCGGNVTGVAMELVPRITRAQSMD